MRGVEINSKKYINGNTDLIDCTWNQTWHIQCTLEGNMESTWESRAGLNCRKSRFSDIIRSVKTENCFYLEKKWINEGIKFEKWKVVDEMRWDKIR